jgi:hypothetical protein
MRHVIAIVLTAWFLIAITLLSSIFLAVVLP